MRLFNQKQKWQNFSGNINITEDINRFDLPKLIKEKKFNSILFFQKKNPTRTTWNTLERLFKQHPNIELRINWRDQMDFKFLSHPFIKAF